MLPSVVQFQEKLLLVKKIAQSLTLRPHLIVGHGSLESSHLQLFLDENQDEIYLLIMGQIYGSKRLLIKWNKVGSIYLS